MLNTATRVWIMKAGEMRWMWLSLKSELSNVDSLIGTHQASAGSPFTPIIAGDPLGTRSSDPYDVPNRVASQDCAHPLNAHQPLNYIKLSCFAFPNPVNILGNASRNAVIGPEPEAIDASGLALRRRSGFGITLNERTAVRYAARLKIAGWAAIAKSAVRLIAVVVLSK